MLMLCAFCFSDEGLHPRHCEAEAISPITYRVFIKHMERGGTVYIMTNQQHTVLYVGVSSKIESRIVEHKEQRYAESFSAKYHVNKLVYYQCFSSIEEAITEEKRIKGGSRRSKGRLINSMNPEWKDLSDELM